MEQERTKFVNKYLRNFTPYRLASHEIWNVKPQERAEILKLDWNEATIPPSPEVIKMIQELVRDGNFYNYYPAVNNAKLLELLSAYTALPVQNIQYFASSDSLHEYIAKLYITVGDPVLIMGPSYDNFRLTAEICGGNIFYYYIDRDFTAGKSEEGFNEEGFLEMINSVDPSMVYICNPNNPTGTQLGVSCIKKLLDSYPDVLFLIDEAYAEFSGISAKEYVLEYENILISRTMSKAFAMANFRFGYLLASQNNINYISRIRNPKNISTFAQVAAVGALSDLAYMRRYVKEVNEARAYFIRESRQYEKYLVCNNSGGNFVLVICRDNKIKMELIRTMEANKIYVRNLSQTDFLKTYGIRITIGRKDQMDRVLAVFKKFFDKAG